MAPHTDDGELGCGGSMAKYYKDGAMIYYAAFSNCASSLPSNLAADTLERECREATALLGITPANLFILNFQVREFPAARQKILEELLQLKKTCRPELVFLPARHDIHQDHQVIYSEGMRAFKDCSLLGYELPWNNTKFHPNYFIRLSSGELDKKTAALKCYRSQEHRPYMKEEFIRSLATVRGIQCGHSLAEGFELYRGMV